MLHHSFDEILAVNETIRQFMHSIFFYTSVLIVVASAHRAVAFDASRWLIDTLKRTVPIWKKEHFEDGAVWSDGEPFPEHVTPSVVEAPAPSPVQSREATPKGSQTKNSASNPIAHK